MLQTFYLYSFISLFTHQKHLETKVNKIWNRQKQRSISAPCWVFLIIKYSYLQTLFKISHIYTYLSFWMVHMIYNSTIYMHFIARYLFAIRFAGYFFSLNKAPPSHGIQYFCSKISSMLWFIHNHRWSLSNFFENDFCQIYLHPLIAPVSSVIIWDYNVIFSLMLKNVNCKLYLKEHLNPWKR